MHLKFWIGFAYVLLFITSEPAFAYLDPGTGSMLLQVVLGGFAALGVALKLFWHKIRVAIGMGRKPDADDKPS
jgi:hypothetical protein